MAIIRIPFSQLQRGPSAAAYAQPGEVSARAEARMWSDATSGTVNALARIDEYQRRRANFAANNLSAEIEIDSDNFESKQYARTDLLELDPDTQQTGFQRAPKEYADYLEQQTKQASAKLPRRFQQDFLTVRRLNNRQKHGAFVRQMTDFETEATVNDAKRRIARMASGIGETDPVTGETERGTPNPVAAFEHAIKTMPSIRSDKQGEVFDYAAEQTAYGLMMIDPDQALAWMEGMQEAFEPEKYRQLTNAAKVEKNRVKSESEKAEKALIKDKFNVASQAIDDGTATGTLLRKLYQQDPARSDKYNEGIAKALAKHFRRMDGASKPDPQTDWSRQQEGQKVVMDFWTGRAITEKDGKEKITRVYDKSDAIDKLQELRYEDRVLSKDDYEMLREQLEAEYSYDTVKAIEGAFGTADRSVRSRYGWFAGDRDELAAQVQRAVLSRVQLAQTKGQPVSPMELSDLAAQLAAGGRQSQSEDIDISGVPVSKSLKQAKKPEFDAEVDEPQTPEDFVSKVAEMKAKDIEEARRYYDRWKDKWQQP